MKKLRNTLIVTVLAMMMVLTAACGSSFDASGYVNSFMDMISKGEVTEYAKLTGQTEAEAGEEYQELLKAMKEALNQDGVTEETKDRLVNVYVELLKRSKYTVHEAEKTDDGYNVTVDIEPITGVYEGLMDEIGGEMDAAIASGELTLDNMYEWIYSKMADKIEGRMDSLTYGEAQSVNIHLVKKDKVYEVDDLDGVSEKIGTLLVDQSGIEGQ